MLRGFRNVVTCSFIFKDFACCDISSSRDLSFFCITLIFNDGLPVNTIKLPI